MNTLYLRTTLWVLLLSILFVNSTQAQRTSPHTTNPLTLSYQAYVEGAKPSLATIRLYRGTDNLEEVWSDTYIVNVTSNVLNLSLGSQKPLPPAHYLDGDLWIGVSFDNGPELKPLTRLTHSAFAINVADSSVTSKKLAMDYVSSISINGQEIRGTAVKLKLLGNVEYNEKLGAITIGKQERNPGIVLDDPCMTNDDGSVATNVVTGGCDNVMESSTSYSVISGGKGNLLHVGEAATISGGSLNDIVGSYSTVGGGIGNLIGRNTRIINTDCVVAPAATISGGYENLIMSMNGSIGGGSENTIGRDGNAATIAGGMSNLVRGDYSAIGGGLSNLIGHDCVVTPGATISGGIWNEVYGNYSTIGGGISNMIGHDCVVPPAATVSGGYYNILNAANGAIGGGSENTITEDGISATVPGGEGLQAQSWAQTVIGAYNEPQGSVPPKYDGSYDANDRIFIIGNGTDDEERSNAFEVSYNGHSIVHDKNGSTSSGGARVPIVGATYQDNIIYAWGKVGGNGSIGSDFGVESVSWGSSSNPGTYVVTLKTVDGSGSPINLSEASITATPINQMGVMMSCSPISSNSFIVKASKYTFTPGPSATLNLEEVAAGFHFQVTGRP